MNVFELFRIATAVATSTVVPVPDLVAIRNLGLENGGDEMAFHERIVEVRTPTFRILSQGDDIPILYLWFAINASNAPIEWKVKALDPLVARWDESRRSVAEKQKGPEWMPFFETIFEETDPKLIEKLETLAAVPFEHAFHAMVDDDSKEGMS